MHFGHARVSGVAAVALRRHRCKIVLSSAIILVKSDAALEDPVQLFCTSGQHNCHAVQQADINTMLRYIHVRATQVRLKYALACDTLRYAIGTIAQPPGYGAVIVEKAQFDTWLNELMRSPFIVQLAPDERSVLITYDAHSTSSVMMMIQLPKQLVGVIAREYPGLPGMQLRVVRREAMSVVVGRCNNCSRCRRENVTAFEFIPPKTVLHQGVLMGAYSQSCLAHEPGMQHLALVSCNITVRSDIPLMYAF